jgi:hypothetical protein
VGPDRSRKSVRLDPVLSSDAGEAPLAAAVTGLGLAALPDWMVAGALQSGELVQVPPGWTGRPTPISAVYAGRGQTPATIRLFVDHLARYLADRAWASNPPSSAVPASVRVDKTSIRKSAGQRETREHRHAPAEADRAVRCKPQRR